MWPDLAKFCYFGNISKALVNSVGGDLVISKILNLLWRFFMPLCKFSPLSMAKFRKNSLALWSQCSQSKYPYVSISFSFFGWSVLFSDPGLSVILYLPFLPAYLFPFQISRHLFYFLETTIWLHFSTYKCVSTFCHIFNCRYPIAKLGPALCLLLHSVTRYWIKNLAKYV